VNRIAVAALTIASVLGASPVTRAQHTDAAAEGTFSIVARDPVLVSLAWLCSQKRDQASASSAEVLFRRR